LGTPRAGAAAAEADLEAVAGQVAHFQFVAVARDGQDADAGNVKVHGLVDIHMFQAHPLARHGLGVLEAGHADDVARAAEGAGDGVGGLQRPEARLLHEEVHVVAGARRVVEGDLGDAEVLGPLLDASAGAGEVGRQVAHGHVLLTAKSAKNAKEANVEALWVTATANKTAVPDVVFNLLQPVRSLRSLRPLRFPHLSFFATFAAYLPARNGSRLRTGRFNGP
jgi:hypothetical protein